MKSHGNPENTYSLHNVDNFNKTLDISLNDITNKYTELVVEYLKFIYENIKVQNLTYSKFIVIRGLETITNVFNIILYYTKNIDITYFQCQKSFYYYIEFIGQITELTINNILNYTNNYIRFIHFINKKNRINIFY